VRPFLLAEILSEKYSHLFVFSLCTKKGEPFDSPFGSHIVFNLIYLVVILKAAAYSLGLFLGVSMVRYWLDCDHWIFSSLPSNSI